MIKQDDGNGNSLIIESRNKNEKNLIDIYLKLKSERHRRHVGTVVEKTRRFHVERSEDVHLLIKGNAYGFNHYILKEAKKFDTVVIHEKNSKNIYEIERTELLQRGRFMFFKQQGFELQIFLNREVMKNFQVLDVDKYCLLQNENRGGF